MSKQDIEKEIKELEDQLENTIVYAPEIYARIVGYYRAYNQYNEGKREEAKLRKNFVVSATGV